MAHVRIEINDREWFDAEVTGWETPPVLPENPNPIPISELPLEVRKVLAQAMGKAMEKATGFEVEVRV